ncbi:MAG: hypothetical protein JXR23_04125 [Pontiellaceae bacterium]|nr:hypothetical protein [Pontiellaceae bacterium]
MKRVIIAILAIVAVNSFAGKIPEAKKLHPELYTIQFTYALFPSSDNIPMTDKEYKRAYEEYENLLEELEEEFEGDDWEMERSLLYGRVMSKALLKHIESCKEVEYKDIATIYTRSGEPFPEAYSNVKGFLNVESNTLVLSEVISKYTQVRKKSTITHFCVNEWSGFGGGWGGVKHNGYLLIKCYSPTNVSSDEED